MLLQMVTRVNLHDWDEPYHHKVLTERLELIRDLRKMKMSDLAHVLKSVSPTRAEQINQMLNEFPK